MEVLGTSLGVLWGSFGGPLGDFLGSLDVLLTAVGCLGGPLGIPGVSWDFLWRLGCDFHDFPGNASFFGVIFWYFPNSAKNATHHENAVNSSQIVGRAAMETSKIRYKIGSKTRSKTASQFLCIFKGFGDPFWRLLGASWRLKAVPNSVMILEGSRAPKGAAQASPRGQAKFNTPPG